MRSFLLATTLACPFLTGVCGTHTFAEEGKKEPPNAGSQYPLLAQVLALKEKGLPPDPAADRAIKILNTRADFDYPGTPIREVLQDLGERFGIAIRPDEPALVAAKVSITVAPIRVDYKNTPLFAGLHDMARTQNLTFHYRYHTIWLTTPQGAKDWKDPAGTLSLKPAKGSPLEKALGEPVNFDFLITPLADLPDALKKHHGLTVDISALPMPVKRGGERPIAHILEKSLPLRDALGILFTLEDCRCHEKDGVLVIEPREKLK